MRTWPSERAWIGLILCLAAGVRLWGLDFGLPQTHCRPDETLVVHPAVQYFSGDFNPHFFRYPSLASYLVFAGAAAYFALGRLTGRFGSLEDLRLEYTVDPSAFHLIARGTSACFGIATVWIVFRIARRWYGRDVALCAAALLAVCHLHVRDSHFGVTDVMQTFFIALAFERTQAWWESGARAAAIGAGVATGLAASSKYVGGLMLLSFALAVVLRMRAQAPRQGFAWSSLLACGIAAALAFVAGTPYSVLDFASFWGQLSAEMEHLQDGQGLDLGSGWVRHSSFSLWHGLGPPVFLASLAGLALLALRDKRRGALLLAFPLAYFALAGSGSAVFVRYAIPWTPFLAIGAAALLVELVQRCVPPAARAAVAVCATLALAAPSIASVVRSDLALSRTDSRELAARWIEQNVEPGSAIAQISNYGRVQLPATRRLRERSQALALAPATSDAARLVRMRQQPSRTREGEGYVACRWRARDGRFVEEDAGPCEPPRYILLGYSPLSMYDRVPSEVATLVAEQYAPIWSVETGAAGLPESRYDAIDAFFLPFAIPGGIQRLGPDLVLYERRAPR